MHLRACAPERAAAVAAATVATTHLEMRCPCSCNCCWWGWVDLGAGVPVLRVVLRLLLLPPWLAVLRSMLSGVRLFTVLCAGGVGACAWTCPAQDPGLSMGALWLLVLVTSVKGRGPRGLGDVSADGVLEARS